MATLSLEEKSDLDEGKQQEAHQWPSSSYHEFVRDVRTIMATKFDDKGGESFTIEMGHLLDRVVIDILDNRSSNSTDENLPVALFWTALVMAMNGPVSDRIRILHELLLIDEGHSHNEGRKVSSVPLSRVRDVVGYLQETCQLPPDTQIVPITEQKYPTQQWRRATPDELLPDCDIAIDTKNNNHGGDGRSDIEINENGVDLIEFAAILRSKTVCAWGECYQKYNPGPKEFEDYNNNDVIPPPPTAPGAVSTTSN